MESELGKHEWECIQWGKGEDHKAEDNCREREKKMSILRKTDKLINSVLENSETNDQPSHSLSRVSMANGYCSFL